MSVLLTIAVIVLILSTPVTSYQYYYDVKILISVFYLFTEFCYYVLYHQPGEWPVADHGHYPVLESATVYIGNITYIKCPKYFINLKYYSPTFICHVDSLYFITTTFLAPND